MSQADGSEPPSTSLGLVVLAAGQGTRMRSRLPKVLHRVAGRPMLELVLGLGRALGAEETVVVLPPDCSSLRVLLREEHVAEQAEQLGTGHAVLQARQALAGRVERVLVLYADTPLIRVETASRLIDCLDQATVAILSAELADPAGYGRVARTSAGAVARIVEEAEATGALLDRREVNSGLMAFRAEWLWQHLPVLPRRQKGEYFLTDLVEMAVGQGHIVACVQTDEPAEIMGINSQLQLAEANRVSWDRARKRLMAEGVTVVDPATTYVEPDVEVGSNTVIHPNTHLQGSTRIGENSQIGPNSIIVDSVIGEGCHVWSSVIENSQLGPNVQLGPFSHIRSGCYLERDVSLGNFTEAKSSRIGQGTQMHHFSYLGDARVGKRVNVGAGTITCNYDGQAKHQTIIGDDAFIGSDSMLVAPLIIGARARTGAGSVVTRDVPDDATVVGVPARPVSGQSSSADEQTGANGE